MRIDLRVRRGLGAAVAVIIASSSLAACGGGAGAGSSRDDGSVTVALAGIPASLDHAQAYSGHNFAMNALHTEPMEVARLDGSYEPRLVESVEQVDDVTLRYTLRDDVKFSDGSSLTADDVAWSLDYLRGESSQMASSLSLIDSVEVTGDHVVEVTTTSPNAGARGIIAQLGFIQKAEFAEAHEADLGSLSAAPIGTGPYVVTEFSAEGATLERNEHYHSEAPLPETVEFVLIADDNQVDLALRSGEVDVAFPANLRLLSQWEEAGNIEVSRTPGLYQMYLSMDTTIAPFDDLDVRRAIALATDREGVTEATYGDEAVSTPWMVMPSVADPVITAAGQESEQFFGGVDGFEYDLEAAREALRMSGHPEGFDVEFTYPSDLAYGKTVGLSIQESLAQIGIDVSLRPLQRSALLAEVYDGEPPPFMVMQMGTSLPDPSGYMNWFMTRDGVLNTARWATQTSDSALEQAKALDPEVRVDAMAELLEITHENIPYVPLFVPTEPAVATNGYGFEREVSMLDRVSANWVRLLKRQ